MLVSVSVFEFFLQEIINPDALSGRGAVTVVHVHASGIAP